ncbi:ImmA/IrrE family metallo-endopeptidase [Rhizobium leguminosarum]
MVASKLRKGFVAEANRWAVDLRGELGLSEGDPMSPWMLAKHLEVPIYRLSALPDCAEKDLLYKKKGGHDFSAAVCFDGLAAFVVTNDGNDPKRQASDIAHELAHVLLRHPPANPFMEDGLRDFSAEHELEAERLGPTLLLSDYAAVRAHRLIVGGQYTVARLSDAWGLSREVIQMRINLSGARRRLSNAA